MADVMEVIYAILDFRGITMEEVENVRIKKEKEKELLKENILKNCRGRLKNIFKNNNIYAIMYLYLRNKRSAF